MSGGLTAGSSKPSQAAPVCEVDKLAMRKRQVSVEPPFAEAKHWHRLRRTWLWGW
jgi:hypothetical protein